MFLRNVGIHLKEYIVTCPRHNNMKFSSLENIKQHEFILLLAWITFTRSPYRFGGWKCIFSLIICLFQFHTFLTNHTSLSLICFFGLKIAESSVTSDCDLIIRTSGTARQKTQFDTIFNLRKTTQSPLKFQFIFCYVIPWGILSHTGRGVISANNITKSRSDIKGLDYGVR
jgi:hypothetical protein